MKFHGEECDINIAEQFKRRSVVSRRKKKGEAFTGTRREKFISTLWKVAKTGAAAWRAWRMPRQIELGIRCKPFENFLRFKRIYPHLKDTRKSLLFVVRHSSRSSIQQTYVIQIALC